MVGARPARVGVLAGQVRRQLARVKARVVAGPGRAGGVRTQRLADGGELAVGELEEARRQRESSVEVGCVLGRHRALVADVVLELRPRVLEHGPDLHRRPAAVVEADQQVAAGVAEPALARGLLAQVTVVVHDDLVAEQLGDSGDIAVHVGDDPDADLVGDVAQRVGIERLTVEGAGSLLGEARHALGAPADAQVVDAGLVEDRGDQRDRPLTGLDQRRLPGGVLLDRAARRVVVLRRERRRDDVAGPEVAVRRDAAELEVDEAGEVGAQHRVDLVLDHPQLALPGGALHLGAQHVPLGPGRHDRLHEADQRQQLTAQQLEVAALLLLVLQGAR